MLAALVLLAAAPLQEPPEPGIPGLPPGIPVLPDAPQEESGTSPDAEELMDQIMEMIETVRGGFQTVDRTLQAAHETVGRPDDDDTELKQSLSQATADADQLLADMEKLLELLPESDDSSASPSSSGRPDQENPQQRQPKDPQDAEQPDSPRDSETMEQDEASAPPDALRQMLLFDPRIGAWGALPSRLQTALENATAEDLPLRYRRWLDSYHRRAADDPR